MALFGSNSNPGMGMGFGRGRGRKGSGGFGIGGNCVCANCGKQLPHQRGQSCLSVKCPDCGNVMVREEMLNPKKSSGSE